MKRMFFLCFICMLLTDVGIAQEIETGIASYYNDSFEGNVTANGEIFSQVQMTAAHKTIPFNTKVMVTNLSNDKSVVVRINDRGPFAKNRIIDLSKKAASKLDFIDQGIAKVKIELLAEN